MTDDELRMLDAQVALLTERLRETVDDVLDELADAYLQRALLRAGHTFVTPEMRKAGAAYCGSGSGSEAEALAEAAYKAMVEAKLAR